MSAPQRIGSLPPAPVRPNDAHKGTFGSVLIVAGSEGMSGAAVLAGRAALHGGAGLVSVGCPRSIYPIVAASHPSYMTLPLDDDEQGKLALTCLNQIEAKMSSQSAIAIGPGLGQSTDVSSTVHAVYEQSQLPLVLDADGLNAFAGETHPLSRSKHAPPRLLTPHPGEFSRLTGRAPASTPEEREKRAVQFAAEHNVVLLLKGPKTIVTDGDRIATNVTGNNGLAKGGSGDVLTGLLASLIAQGMSVFEAAQLGAFLHGLAADCAATDLSKRYVTSYDLLDYLNRAWLRYEGKCPSR